MVKQFSSQTINPTQTNKWTLKLVKRSEYRQFKLFLAYETYSYKERILKLNIKAKLKTILNNI